MSREQSKHRDERREEEKPEQKEEDLPFCTTAADPEHLRGADMDMEEPCDDARTGEYEKEEEEER